MQRKNIFALQQAIHFVGFKIYVGSMHNSSGLLSAVAPMCVQCVWDFLHICINLLAIFALFFCAPRLILSAISRNINMLHYSFP